MSARAVRLPAWAREVESLLPITAQFVLFGNTRDLYVVPGPDGSIRPRTLADTTREVLEGSGVTAVLELDAGGIVRASTRDAVREALGLTLHAGQPVKLDELASVVETVVEAVGRVGLIVSAASRLCRDPARLNDDEYAFFKRIDHVARRAHPEQREGAGPRGCHNPIVWILDAERDLPDWLVVLNPLVRSIAVGLPDHDARQAVAEVLLANLEPQPNLAPPSAQTSRVLTKLPGGAKPATQTPPDNLAGSVTAFLEQTAGMTLVDMRRIADLAAQQGLDSGQIEDAARCYRVGVVDSPWKQATLADRLHGAEDTLRCRVKGQDDAIRKAVDLLIRSATGLGGSHMSSSATRPRGVLFFAGPTGVGKTELARALTEILFDSDQQYIRFDMSEFAEQQAAERLIGAPPGFVGYDAGGELTNAVRQKPFSLVLFDEIEKAHPRILDKFLQVLDDGRLTDGRGETVYFTETLIVFTSNLGVYEDVLSGGQVVDRRSRFGSDASLATIQDGVTKAIEQYFTRDLMRPELFGRLGDNVVVFDFIKPETARVILELQVRRVIDAVAREHRFELVIDQQAIDTLSAHCLADTSMGGRGIGSRLETALVNPLARAIFGLSPGRAPLQHVVLAQEATSWSVRLTPG